MKILESSSEVEALNTVLERFTSIFHVAFQHEDETSTIEISNSLKNACLRTLEARWREIPREEVQEHKARRIEMVG